MALFGDYFKFDFNTCTKKLQDLLPPIANLLIASILTAKSSISGLVQHGIVVQDYLNNDNCQFNPWVERFSSFFVVFNSLWTITNKTRVTCILVASYLNRNWSLKFL